ncbi:cytochrome c oxidase accessory protein CcoG [Falsiroseomonas selenitidurans]|uniref:Cytochrome c oxidase accessory protein CcoG n=1 Tax=Falsiroseomonas selenitidurans TaxID=2716335 RepID=A0ABX1DXA6_9PROT|nr:cytochrome c oxidase accessory protein CcoG [Falsiroseomonas selenitidurans]NKC29537.1 cytochrome c oxidase accessory protein CcoG [Falsiroseomonas selenitidurans]
MSTIQPPNRLRPAPAAPAAAQPLYASRQKVYPKAVGGTVRRAKWAVLILCLAAYYIVPWLRWDRGPGAPDQAVLVDLAHGRLFFFFIEIWPQEVYFLTGLLVLGAIGLFVATSLFGRVWCGFACPQTVWTDLFMWVERLIQGDRNERMRLDKAPWSWAKARKKGLTHAAWLLIAAATGGAWIMYFNDAPTVTVDLLTGGASTEVYFFFALFSGTTYLLAGWAREQVCTYMCPWPRFQAAMLDENSLVVTYRDWRGEPRGKAKEDGVGDCVDCHACVNVCPTGIDIRDGQQLECIGCGLCIDACDDIMKRLDRPKGLIAFETLANLAASTAATRALPPAPTRCGAGMAVRRTPRFIRPRTLLYAAMLTAVAGVMLGAMVLRQTVTLSVLRDRAPLFVALSDGAVRNAFTLKIANKDRESPALVLDLVSPQPLQVQVQEAAPLGGNRFRVTTRADGITQWRVLATRPADAAPRETMDITFRLLDAQGRVVVTEHSVFLGPRR